MGVVSFTFVSSRLSLWKALLSHTFLMFASVNRKSSIKAKEPEAVFDAFAYLAMYVDIKERFGWDVLRKVCRSASNSVRV